MITNARIVDCTRNRFAIGFVTILYLDLTGCFGSRSYPKLAIDRPKVICGEWSALRHIRNVRGRKRYEMVFNEGE